MALYDHEPDEGSPHDHLKKQNARLDTDNKWDTNVNWEIGGHWVAYVRQGALPASASVRTQLKHNPQAPQSAPSSTYCALGTSR